MAIVMFALSLTVNKIFANQEKLQKFDRENEGHGQVVEERNLHHSTRNVCNHIDDCFSTILSKWQHMFMQKVTHTHTHKCIRTHIHAQRETGVMTVGKICITDLPNNRS